ncbi:MAG: hypothetical protein ACKVW3_07630 [Phycisphaerales bacterium]
MTTLLNASMGGVWRLERLEDRTHLAVIAWDGGPGGSGTNWHDPVNWAGDVLPAATDEAVINVPGSPQISVSQAAIVQRLTCDEAISISGELSVALASVVSGAATLSGTVSGTGDLVLAGGLAWVGGTMGGTGKTTVPPGALLDITGTAHDLNRTLEAAGTGQWSAGTLRFSAGTLLNTGSLTITTAGLLQALGVAGTNSITNQGTIAKIGAGELQLVGGASGVSLNNSGTISLTAGTLNLGNGGQTSTLIAAPSGTTLVLGGTIAYGPAGGLGGAGAITFQGGTHTLPTGQFSATGAVSFAGGAVTIANPFTPTSIAPIVGTVSFLAALGYTGPLSILGSASFAAPQSFAALTLSGTLAGSGDVTITGPLSWLGGIMSGAGRTIIAPSGSLELSTPGTRTISRSINNNGSANWADGILAFASGAINNAGTMTASTATSLSAFGNSGVNAINNSGTLSKLGAGSLTLGVNVTGVALNNTGTTSIQGGSLVIAGGGSNLSLISVPVGGEAVFASTFTHAAGGTLSGAGVITFNAGVHLLPAGQFAPAGTLNLTGGTITLSGTVTPTTLGPIGATVTFNAALGFTGPVTITGSASFAVAQTLSSLSLTGTLSGAGDTTITGVLDWSAGAMSGTGRTIIAPAGQIVLASGATRTLARTLTVNGSALWTGGAISFASGSITNNGTFTANTDATLTASGASGVNAFTNAGTFAKLGTGVCQFIIATTAVAFNHTGTLSIQGGTLVLGAGGVASAALPVLPGATLSFAANYTLSPGAVISGAGTVEFTGGTISIPAGQFLPTGIVSFAGGTVTIANTFSPSGLFPITGTVNFNAPQTFTVVTLAGTIGGIGNVTITAFFEWQSGTMSGAGRTILPTSATAQITTPALHTLARAFDVSGTASWIDGELAFNAGTLTIASTATLTINSNSLLRAYGAGGTNSLTSAGRINKFGTGEARFEVATTGVSLTNQLGGVIDIQAGAVTLAGGGSNAGSITVAALATLAFGANYTHAPSGTISGPGRVTFSAGTHSLPAGAFVITGPLDLAGGTITFGGNITPSVVLPIAATVTFSGSLGYAGALTISGSANFALPQAFASLALTGTLAGAGDVTILGSLTWTAGTMSGTGDTIVGAAGTLTLSGVGHSLGRVLSLLGTANWTAGDLTLNSGELRIDPAASLDADLVAATSVLVTALGGKIVNAGVFNKLGTATLLFSSAAPGAMLESDGTVAVSGGTLNLGGGGMLDGSISVASGATLTLSGSMAYAASVSILGSGTINFSGGTHALPVGFAPTGTINFNSGMISVAGPLAPTTLGAIAATVSFAGTLVYVGAITISGSASFAQPQSITTLTLSGMLTGAGAVTITTTATWSAGTMSGAGTTTIAAGATLTISGAAHSLARTLRILGSATWTAGALNFNSGTLRNEASLTINNTGTLVAAGTGTIENLGTITKLGSGDAQIAVALQHTGAINFQAGTLTLTGGGSVASAIAVPAGATLVLGGVPIYSTGAAISGAGTVTFTAGTHSLAVGQFLSTGTVNFAGGTITIAGPFVPAALGTIAGTVTFLAAISYSGGITITGSASFAGTQSFASLTLTGTLAGAGMVTITGNAAWNGGTMAGSGSTIVGSAGTLTISTAPHSLSRRLELFGTGTWSAGNIAFTDGTLVIAQGGTLSVTTTGTMSATGPSGVNAIINRGTLTKIGTGTVQTTAANASITFDNQGIVNVNSNTLALLGPVLQVSGDTLTGGIWNIADTCTLNLPVGVAIRVNGGAIRLAGATSAFPAVNGLTTNNGTLTIADGRAFSFAPLGNNFLNAGQLIKAGTGATNIPATITLNNVGLLSVTGGTFTINGPVTQIVAGLLSGGSWFVGTSSTLAIPGATLTTSNAVVTLSGTNSSFVAFNSVRTSTNSLTVTAGRNLTLPNLTASGKVTVGAGSTLNVTGALTNSAIVSIGGGTLNASGGGMTTGRYELSNAGSVSLAGGHTLTAAAAIIGNGDLALGTGTQSVAAAINITGVLTVTVGLATLSANAAVGSLNLSGSLALGTSTLSVAGSVTCNPSASVSFRADSATTFGRIIAAGSAALDGMALVTWGAGYFPAVGAYFKLIGATSRTGTFASLSLASPGPGRSAIPRYDATGFAVSIAAANGSK